MKILILANSDVGLYKFRKELLEEMLRPGTYLGRKQERPCQVFVSLPDGEFITELEKMGCKIIKTPVERRGMNPLKDLSLLMTYRKILNRVGPDVVLTYTIKPNIYGGLMCGLKKIDYISNVTGLGTSIENGGLMSKFILHMYKVGLYSAKTVFFQNKRNQKLFKNIVRSPSRLIPGSGVNLKEHCFEDYPEDDGTIRFLFVGRIMKAKGIEEFLDCAERIREIYLNTEFSILGNFDEQIYRPRVETLDKRGIIHYYGQQKDVHSFFKTHHVTVLPSYHEGLSNVLLESSASGRPVIATTVSGCIETYDDGISGIGFEAKSSEALIGAVKEFMALPYERKKEMGIAARKKVEKEFDKKMVIKSYLDAINI